MIILSPKSIKLILYLVLILILLAVSAYFYAHHQLGFTLKRELKADQTVIIIEEMRKISELFTSVYYDELVLDTIKAQDRGALYRLFDGMTNSLPTHVTPTQKATDSIQFVVIAKGKIMAGYDFSEIKQEDMQIDENAITFALPPPKILEVVINPSDYEIFLEEGSWTLDEAVELKKKAGKQMEIRAIEHGIFQESEETATAILENYFRGLDFEEITIKTTPADDSELHLSSPSAE